jgi:hypothetical protein
MAESASFFLLMSDPNRGKVLHATVVETIRMVPEILARDIGISKT